MVQKHKSIGYMMITLLSLCLMFSLCVPMVFADDLNGVGSGNNVVNETVQTPVSTPETTVPQTNTSTTNTTNTTTTKTDRTGRTGRTGKSTVKVTPKGQAYWDSQY